MLNEEPRPMTIRIDELSQLKESMIQDGTTIETSLIHGEVMQQLLALKAGLTPEQFREKQFFRN